MADRYLRRCTLSIGSQFQVISDATPHPAKISFEASHSLNEHRPSKVSVWGLSEGTAALAVVGVNRDELSLFAGYRGAAYGEILRGKVVKAYQQRESAVDRVLTLVVGPSSAPNRSTKTITLQERDTTVKALVQRAADELGIEGPDPKFLPDAAVQQFSGTYSPTDIFSEILDSYGVTWAEDDGKIVVSSESNPYTRVGGVVEVNEQTGLIGSPSLEENGEARCKVLLSPEIFVGSTVDLRSELLSGRFRVKSVLHEGDTYGEAWTSSLVLTP